MSITFNFHSPIYRQAEQRPVIRARRFSNDLVARAPLDYRKGQASSSDRRRIRGLRSHRCRDHRAPGGDLASASLSTLKERPQSNRSS